MANPSKPNQLARRGFTKVGIHEIAARRIADTRADIKGVVYVVVRAGNGFAVGPLSELTDKDEHKILYRTRSPEA